MRKAAIYARVSTSDQTVANQAPEVREYAKRRDWQVVAEYVDEGVSGAKDSRPGLDRLMRDARRRKFDAVIVVRFDRFARSTTHLLSALEEFRALGIDFVSIREAVDTSTPMGRMVFTICAAVAELERSLIQERVRAGIDRARKEGVRFGRPRKGFDYKRAVALRDKGWSIRRIAKELGVSRSTIQRIVSG